MTTSVFGGRARARGIRALLRWGMALAVLATVSGCAATLEETPGAVGIPVGAEPMTVAYVYDGDTIYLQPAAGDELKVRLLGVDTAELRPQVECSAEEARDWLRAMLPEGETVMAAPDVEALDRYGRSLFYVWTDDGSFVNLELVAEGWAEAIRVGPNDAHYAELLDAEHDAAAAGAGRWGRC